MEHQLVRAKQRGGGIFLTGLAGLGFGGCDSGKGPVGLCRACVPSGVPGGGRDRSGGPVAGIRRKR